MTKELMDSCTCPGVSEPKDKTERLSEATLEPEVQKEPFQK
jgi:hypothetical protein